MGTTTVEGIVVDVAKAWSDPIYRSQLGGLASRIPESPVGATPEKLDATPRDHLTSHDFTHCSNAGFCCN